MVKITKMHKLMMGKENFKKAQKSQQFYNEWKRDLKSVTTQLIKNTKRYARRSK